MAQTLWRHASALVRDVTTAAEFSGCFAVCALWVVACARNVHVVTLSLPFEVVVLPGLLVQE